LTKDSALLSADLRDRHDASRSRERGADVPENLGHDHRTPRTTGRCDALISAHLEGPDRRTLVRSDQAGGGPAFEKLVVRSHTRHDPDRVVPAVSGPALIPS
jgi:hypothetical protein